MKKIFVLMLSLGTITSVFAQGGHDKDEARDIILGKDNRSVVYNDNKPGNDSRYNSYSNDLRRKEAIDKINRDYDFQVAAVKRNRYLSWKEKDRQIQRLERDKAAKIREVMERFNDRKDVRLDNHNGRRF